MSDLFFVALGRGESALEELQDRGIRCRGEARLDGLGLRRPVESLEGLERRADTSAAGNITPWERIHPQVAPVVLLLADQELGDAVDLGDPGQQLPLLVIELEARLDIWFSSAPTRLPRLFRILELPVVV